MQHIAYSSVGSLAVAALLLTAGSFTVSAQLPSSQVVSPLLEVRLTSFTPDPASVINPRYPVATALKHAVSGAPTHYRFSRFADFRDATWLDYTPAPVAQIPASWFTGPLARREVVLHFQVRTKNPKAGRPVSAINDGGGRTNVKTEPRFLISAPRSATLIAISQG